MHLTPQGTGWIEVITGCMFSGKTEELIRRLVRARYAKQEVRIFKPRIDTRYSEDEIVSHSRMSLRAHVVEKAEDVWRLGHGIQVVAVDEVQFFGAAIVPVVESLANSGSRVLVAGLDQDYRGEPFEPIPTLMAVAEFVTKNHAICMQCGNPADRSQRLVNRAERVLVGETESYEARCRRCFSPDLPGQIQQNLMYRPGDSV
ncbi:MAG: thymidine kinase [Rickettsiales bacterium]|nr:thymidine kinase [Rickettsiales bacterium]|tara:strand:- start:2594 stop:3199 length:606 start_codon:yes stop_codon:yes gene_type:complete